MIIESLGKFKMTQNLFISLLILMGLFTCLPSEVLASEKRDLILHPAVSDPRAIFSWQQKRQALLSSGTSSHLLENGFVLMVAISSVLTTSGLTVLLM